MKYILPIFCLFTLPAFGKRLPYSDSSQNSLTLSWGVFSTDFILDGNNAKVITGEINGYSIGKFTGTACLTWKYILSKRFSIGISAVYENINGSWYEKTIGYPYIGDLFVGTFKRNLFTIAPEITITYKNSRNGILRLYGAIAIGYTYSNEVDTYDLDFYNGHYLNGINTLGESTKKENNIYHVNGQITGFGITLGKKLAFNLEAGLGYKGILNAGIKLKL